ncbi:DoxX family protein [Guptibacillus hwajinpoensis]|uniref:Thiosulfate dehydrogenase [quinone] large subunit n=1 Tax=Guptibacillus hwajinpoensis TaxID=208199 RepID=A0ABU0JYY6_9BACL|nr:DoxX family membrane protein [Alkalihalobacillus hemicentroti]MDQ0481122.1 thiosulfate dehydrogenase [quinone] large subunit [Alkalihalobacillus hemicentroti]
MGSWLRSSKVAAVILTILRVFVGWKFLSAGWGKIVGPEPFDASGFLKGAIGKASGEHPAVQQWYASFLENFALPNVELFNFLVPVGEVLIGIGLIFGVFTRFSSFMGAFLNFSFLFAGTISVNPNLIIIEFILIASATNAGRFGIDYYLKPLFDKTTSRLRNSHEVGSA